MGTIVKRNVIKRQKGYLYYLKGNDLYKAKMKRR